MNSVQVDGKASLAQQEIQLQTLETFFVEVIDYSADSNTMNDVTAKNISTPVAAKIHLAAINSSADLAAVSAKATSLVFDRVVFVSGQNQRVVGYR